MPCCSKRMKPRIIKELQGKDAIFGESGRWYLQIRPIAQGPDGKLKLRIIKELEGNIHTNTHTYTWA